MLLHHEEADRAANGPVEECCPPAELVSPALAVNGKSLPAYELKFLLQSEQALQLEARLRRHLQADPHGDPALSGAYLLSSLYFDTPDLAIYHRQPGHRRHKYRVRRYGDEPKVYLERKSKKAGRVRKRRAIAPTGDAVTWLTHSHEAGEASEGDAEWFRRQVATRQLRPVCKLAYQRTAFVGPGEQGSVRVTVDRDVRAWASMEHAPPTIPGTPLLSDQAVVEFKFLAAPPLLFKEIIAEMKLALSRCSKYRLGVQAVGLAQPRMGEVGDA